MPIKKSPQKWEVGEEVRIGFIPLVVRAVVETPGDGNPGGYLLTNRKGTQLYSFVPFNGIHKVTVEAAQKMLDEARRAAAEYRARTRKKSDLDDEAAEQARRDIDQLFTTGS